MMKLTISTGVLLLCGLFAKAQDFPVYKPIEYGNGRPTTAKPESDENAAEIIDAYAVNDATRAVKKIKIKVVFGTMSNKIVAYRSLADKYWSVASGYVHKLDVNDKLAERFEYKGYLNGLLIYF